MDLAPSCTSSPPGVPACPRGPWGPSRWDGCGPLTCVLGKFPSLRKPQHLSAEAWTFSKHHFLKTWRGRVAVTGSLLGQAHPRSPAGRATLANPPSARAFLAPVSLRPRGPRTPAGLLLWDSVCLPHPVSHPGLRWSQARPAPGPLNGWSWGLEQVSTRSCRECGIAAQAGTGDVGSGVQPWCL